MESMIKDWTRLLTGCLQKRIKGHLFATLAAQLHAKAPLPGRQLASVVLAPRSKDAVTTDPLELEYIERLLDSKKVDTADVLLATLRFSKARPSKPDQEAGSIWTNPSDLEEILFARICKGYVTENRPLSIIEGSRVVLVVSTWMQAMVTSHNSYNMIQAMSGIQQLPLYLISVRESLGALVVGIIENPRVLHALSNPKVEAIRKNFARSLSTFITFLSDGSAQSQNLLQIANRLELSQKQHELYDKPPAVNGEASESTGLEVAAMQLEAVMDLPIMNTRAGLYIFLNSLLIAKPLTDDVMIIAWLHSRYKLELQNMAIHLTTAAFDILANALYRSEPTTTMFYLKSFLVNKVPILISQLSGSIFPSTPELSITQALGHVDLNAFPSPSQGFEDMMGSNNPLSDVRQDFLNACALHGLIPATAVERLLGETPMQGPPGMKYDRKQLLDQCKSNFDKVMLYIDELENLDGNAGAIVSAITDFISHLCETQMTMSLKQLAGLISKKPQAMDIMLQFTSPASILQPLCQSLDEWHYDSDQSEYQLVYDEFGAILVLVMAFVYRYDFTPQDLGVRNDSFVARLIGPGQRRISPSDLTEEQGKQLGSWLKGFYDSNQEGLSNDVFASCRPQDFYLIVPTLFHQSVVALSNEVLSFETVKGGLEYLGEPFLLPSLIGGLIWMASYALEQPHNDLEALMKIFKEVILSTHSSADVQAMHSTILAMVTSRLEKCFRALQQHEPSRQDIEPLLQAIKGHAHYERTSYTVSLHSTSVTALRSTVHQLSQWGSSVTLQPNPPSYTHQQIYTAVKVLGASKTIRAIVDEIKAETDAGNGAAGLDVGMSIVCAPTVEDSPILVDWVGSSIPAPSAHRTCANLRDMLKEEYDNAASLVATDLLTAETIVRLHRRVEAQLASMGDFGLQAPALTGLPGVNIADMTSQSITDDINKAMDDAAAATLAEDITKMDDKALQRSMEEITVGEGIDLASIGITGEASGELGSALGMADLDLSMEDMGMDMDMSMDMKAEDDWGLDFDNM